MVGLDDADAGLAKLGSVGGKQFALVNEFGLTDLCHPLAVLDVGPTLRAGNIVSVGVCHVPVNGTTRLAPTLLIQAVWPFPVMITRISRGVKNFMLKIICWADMVGKIETKCRMACQSMIYDAVQARLL